MPRPSLPRRPAREHSERIAGRLNDSGAETCEHGQTLCLSPCGVARRKVYWAGAGDVVARWFVL